MNKFSKATLILVMLILTRPVFSNPFLCDKQLQGTSDIQYGYRQRGNRCEGIYAKAVSLTALQVVSLTTAYSDFNTDSGKPVQLTWRSPKHSTIKMINDQQSNYLVHLRGQSLKRRLYYRMDTQRTLSEHQFDWPVFLLHALSIKKSKLGISAWVRGTIAGVEQTIYLPLELRQEEETIALSSPFEPVPSNETNPRKRYEYRMVIIPGQDLEEVYITITALNENGDLGESVIQALQLNYGNYPAERPISIGFSVPIDESLYLIEIGATLISGGVTATNLILYN